MTFLPHNKKKKTFLGLIFLAEALKFFQLNW